MNTEEGYGIEQERNQGAEISDRRGRWPSFHGRFGVPVLGLLALLGGMFWAKSRDPFERIWFRVRTPDFGSVEGVTVLPKSFRACPVAIYLHGSGGTLLADGTELRRFAELGVAAVSIEYNKTNQEALNEQFVVVQNYLQRQSWAMTNAVAWIGFSLGAQEVLRFVLAHPDQQPQVLVRAAGGWLEDPEDADKIRGLALKCPVLLVHGEKDQVFPMDETRLLAELLKTNGARVDLEILPHSGHSFEGDHALVMRLIAEYCKAKLTPGQPMPEVPQLRPVPFWVCMVPAFVWAAICIKRNIAHRASNAKHRIAEAGDRRLWEKALRWAAAGLAVLAIADTAVHLIPLQLEVSAANLNIARMWLVPPKWKSDFEALAAQPVWQGQRLKTLLDHVELAHYTVNELVNWKVSEQIYTNYVLSPVITEEFKVQGSKFKVEEMGWRRPLWDSFYPRVRHEQTPEAAAEIVARYLRERVTVVPGYTPISGIETIWKSEIVDQNGFEMIYVAALRSVGIGARLDAKGQAEFWTGEKWLAAPRAIAMSFLQ
jgi:dienelactone hydrolase